MSNPIAAPDALQRIGFTSLIHRAALAANIEPSSLARVVERHRDRFVVHDGTRTHSAQLRASAAADAVVGDWVVLGVIADAQSKNMVWIEALLPRQNLLSRGRESGIPQPLVANIDTVLLVMGLDGNYRLNRLERLLLLARAAGAAPVILLSKADRCEISEARVIEVQDFVGPQVPVFAGDVRDPAFARQLAPWLAPGQTLVLLGSSGVGKSTLTNTLTGESLQKTGEVSAEDDRGRHTTVSRRLLSLPGGACLIDTPGLRELALTGEETLNSGAYDDIATYAMRCRFRDCQHGDEPDCAVRESVEPARLETYHRLVREQALAQQTALARAAQKQDVKVQTKELRRFYRARDEE